MTVRKLTCGRMWREKVNRKMRTKGGEEVEEEEKSVEGEGKEVRGGKKKEKGEGKEVRRGKGRLYRRGKSKGK